MGRRLLVGLVLLAGCTIDRHPQPGTSTTTAPSSADAWLTEYQGWVDRLRDGIGEVEALETPWSCASLGVDARAAMQFPEPPGREGMWAEALDLLDGHSGDCPSTADLMEAETLLDDVVG